MSGHPLKSVQKALFDELTGDAPLQALIVGVFDEIPQNTALPYVQIGDATSRPWHVFARTGWQVDATIIVHSENPGNLESLNIAEAINDVLDDQTFTLDDMTLVRCFETGATPRQQPSGFERELAMTYQLWLQET